MPTNYKEIAEGYLIDTSSLPEKYYKFKKGDYLQFVSFNIVHTNNWRKMHHKKMKRRIGRKFRRMKSC